MTGDATRIPFGLLFSLRSNLGQQRALSILTVLAVAMSVALAVGLYLSAAAVEGELERTAESLRGMAQIEVTSGAVGIRESLIEEVRAVPGVRAAAPVVEESVRLAGAPGAPPLRVLGVDLLADQSIRRYTVVSQGLEVLDPLRLVVGVDSVIVTELLAEQLGLGQGDALRVRSPRGTERALVVRGLLTRGGVADAYGGQIVVMDVYALQMLLGRPGWLDRIDVATRPDADPAAVMAAIEARVLGRATVRPAANQDEFVRATMSTLQLTGGIIAAVGIVAAALLSYGAVSVSVRRRTRVFGLLRAAGLESRRVRRLVYVDSLVVAALGTAFGIPVGWWLSGVLLQVFSGTTRFVRGAGAGEVELTWATLALGALVGIAVAWVGSLAPALRASSRSPLDVIMRSGPERREPLARRPWLLALLGAAVWVALWLAPLPLPAVPRTGLVLLAGLGALALALELLLGWVTGSAGALTERLLPGLGRVIAASLRARLNHSRIAVASIAGLVAATASVLVVLHSVATTMDEAVVRHGEVLVTASDPFQSIRRDPIRPETSAAIEATPGVRAVFHHYNTETLFRNEIVNLRAVSAGVYGRYGEWRALIGGDMESVSLAMQDGGAVVTQAFSRHFGLGVGDLVELPTPSGARDFRIVGINETFSEGPTGAIRLDVDVFDRLWPREGSTNLLIWVDEPREAVLERIQRGPGELQMLFFTRSEQLERFMRDQIAASSHLLYLLIAIVAGIGGLCVVNLLVGSIAEQRRDLGLFRSAGATSAQIGLLVVIDGAVITWIGAGAGIVLGLACSTSMMDLLQESFGWSVRYAINPRQLAALAASVAGVSALAGIYPGLSARRISPAEALASE